MKIPRRRLYSVSNEIPVEFHPIMAAFMSYCWRVIDKKPKHRSDYVKRYNTMTWKLLCFLEPEYNADGVWRRAMPLFYRRGLLKKKLTKNDETIMTPTEQLQLFTDAATQNGKNIACYLFEKGNRNAIIKIKEKEKENVEMNIPIIQLEDGQYAATSWDSGFNFEL